jgi:hypothetical protein
MPGIMGGIVSAIALAMMNEGVGFSEDAFPLGQDYSAQAGA